MILTGIWWLDMNKIYRHGSVEEMVITKTDPLKTRLVAGEQHYKEGNSLQASARHGCVSTTKLHEHLKKRGIMREKGGNNSPRYMAAKLYTNGFMSTADIAKKCGISVRTLYRELDRLGIEKRSEK